jgi:hypothetical protein
VPATRKTSGERADPPEAVHVEHRLAREHERLRHADEHRRERHPGEGEAHRRSGGETTDREREDHEGRQRGTREREPDRTDRADRTEEAEPGDDPERRAGVDAEDARIRDRVAGERLHQHARRAEGRAAEDRVDGAVDTQGAHDVQHILISGAE